MNSLCNIVRSFTQSILSKPYPLIYTPNYNLTADFFREIKQALRRVPLNAVCNLVRSFTESMGVLKNELQKGNICSHTCMYIFLCLLNLNLSNVCIYMKSSNLSIDILTIVYINLSMISTYMKISVYLYTGLKDQYPDFVCTEATKSSEWRSRVSPRPHSSSLSPTILSRTQAKEMANSQNEFKNEAFPNPRTTTKRKIKIEHKEFDFMMIENNGDILKESFSVFSVAHYKIQRIYDTLQAVNEIFVENSMSQGSTLIQLLKNGGCKVSAPIPPVSSSITNSSSSSSFPSSYAVSSSPSSSSSSSSSYSSSSSSSNRQASPSIPTRSSSTLPLTSSTKENSSYSPSTREHPSSYSSALPPSSNKFEDIPRSKTIKKSNWLPPLVLSADSPVVGMYKFKSPSLTLLPTDLNPEPLDSSRDLRDSLDPLTADPLTDPLSVDLLTKPLTADQIKSSQRLSNWSKNTDIIDDAVLDLSALPVDTSALLSETVWNQSRDRVNMDISLDISLNDTLNTTHTCTADVDGNSLNNITAQNFLDTSHIYIDTAGDTLGPGPSELGPGPGELSPGSGNDDCHIYVSDVVENVLLDFINWLQEIVKECQLLQRPKKTIGIIDMSESSVEDVIEKIGATMRNTYMSGQFSR